MPRTYQHLRLADASCFRAYSENTRLWTRIGNEAFARYVLENRNPGQAARSGDSAPEITYKLYHSWMPQMMDLTTGQADIIRALMRSNPDTQLTPEQQQWSDALADIHWLDQVAVDIDALVDRTLDRVIAIQNRYELTEYLRLVAEKQPQVVVEIGTARGGMLYCFSQLAAPDALLVSIDLPGAPNCGGQTDIERRFFSSFARAGQSMRFIPANSRFATTREMLRSILGERKVDILFIDGDHSYGGVLSDYEMYRGFVTPGGMITFHDIRLKPEHWGPGNEVGVFWDRFAEEHDVVEIVDPDGICRRDRPEGVQPCWGIGILYSAEGDRCEPQQ
jgi:cephalosporin hydroxylase